MTECKLYGRAGELCVPTPYIKTDKEIMDFDFFASGCPYNGNNGELYCDNPYNETFEDTYGECDPFECPHAYLPCKKDIANLNPDEYEGEKEYIDQYPDQPYIDIVVVMKDIIRQDPIKHFFFNYPWTSNWNLKKHGVF